MQVLGISGSLREGSLNRLAVRAAGEHLPDGVRLEPFELDEIPLYNEDVRVRGFPAPVQRWRQAIAGADALLIATPEYNYSVPGVLKNAIDWASRPPDQPFSGKPVAIMGASPGRFGSARAQYHLRQILVGLNAMVLNRPEVMLAHAPDLFDEEGKLTDEASRDHVSKLMAALVVWTARVQAGASV